MTQRDEGHNYRDSKNKAIEYERKKETEIILEDSMKVSQSLMSLRCLVKDVMSVMN